MVKDKNVYGVILCGGSGTRFWPLSRQEQPKQFLKIVGKESLFQMTLKRLAPRIRPENVVVVTNKKYAHKVWAQALESGLKGVHVLQEPTGKNTAPAIAWATAKIHQINPEAVMGVFPADHLILKQEAFLKAFDAALALARDQFLVTFGIPPTRPETGYGYLKTVQRKVGRKTVVLVDQFTEKPSLSQAKQLVKRKTYLWNSGMFVWRVAVIREAFQRHLPHMHAIFTKARGRRPTLAAWAGLPSVSIDYGILEKADQVAAVPASGIGWTDLGSWESLYESLEKDGQGNVVRGEVVAPQTSGSLVYGDTRLVGVIGLKDVVVVDTPDALLVCHKQASQQIKEMVEFLVAARRKEI